VLQYMQNNDIKITSKLFVYYVYIKGHEFKQFI